MRVYQSSNGQWIYFDGETKTYFNTQAEALEALAMDERKQKFAKAVIENVHNKIAQAVDGATQLKDVFIDRGYNVGGNAAFTDEDLAELGITAAQFEQGITLIAEFLKFTNNGVPVKADYSATLNILRNDL